jgi:asparagine synthase (glutamine-hydrolysing)
MQLDGLLDASVKQRLVADVPLGVFLSGGLDSSAIAYYAQRNSAVPIKTFTIRFDEESFDESVYAAKLAKQVGTDHHVATVSAKEALACIPSLLASVDEPLADASLIPTFLLSRFARMEVTVALGGDGGDELFTGYPTFQAEKIEPLYRFLRGMFGTRLLTAIADSIPLTEKYLSLNFKLKRFLRGQDLPALYRHAVWMGSFAVIDFKDLFNQVVYNHIKNVPVFDVIEAYVTAPQLTSEQKLFLFYLRVYLMDGVLVKVDRASMLNGLEVRAPFLDYKLVAWASGLPHQYKMKGLTTKYILKSSSPHSRKSCRNQRARVG